MPDAGCLFFFLLQISHSLSLYICLSIWSDTGGMLKSALLKILFLVEGRSVFHKWRCSLWRNYTLWLRNWVSIVWCYCKWDYPSSWEGSPTAVALVSEIFGMVNSYHYESYGPQLQIQVVHIWYAWRLKHDLSTSFLMRKYQNFYFLDVFLTGLPNFGAVEIDWNATPVTLKIEVRDVNGNPVVGVATSLSELQLRNFNSSTTKKTRKHQRHCSLEVSLPWIVRYRLAILASCALASMLLSDFELYCWVLLAWSVPSCFVSSLHAWSFSVLCKNIYSLWEWINGTRKRKRRF